MPLPIPAGFALGMITGYAIEKIEPTIKKKYKKYKKKKEQKIQDEDKSLTQQMEIDLQ